MSPWRINNPFDEEPEEEGKKEKPIPSTMVLVECEGCKKGITIRVAKKDNGHKIVNCHNCLHVIDVTVNNLKSIQVWQYNPDFSDRKQTPFEKVWQE